MKVLIACEFSGIVREAFRARGHDAWSCDIIPTECKGQHIVNDVRNVLDWGWDLMIAHPPCTYLSRAAAHLRTPARLELAKLAYRFVLALWAAPIASIAIENPYGLLFQWWRKPDQIVHPWMFGHPQTKATCLWLKQLPPLMCSLIVATRDINWTEKGLRRSNGDSKATARSRTFAGLAQAMADQWG